MPLYEFECKKCCEVFEDLVGEGETPPCPLCSSESELIISSSTVNWKCSVSSSSMGKPTSEHPRGSNFAWGKEIDRVRKEKKDMNEALKKGKKFKTGNRVVMKKGETKI